MFPVARFTNSTESCKRLEGGEDRLTRSKSTNTLLSTIDGLDDDTKKDLQQRVEMLIAVFFIRSAEVQSWGEFQTEETDSSVEEAQ
jgi:hypothetical protein